MKIAVHRMAGLAFLPLLLIVLGSGVAQDRLGVARATANSSQVWRKKIKQARHCILLFDSAMNSYYDAVLWGRLDGDRRAVDRMINGSIGARQSMNALKGCTEEYKKESEILQEIYGLIKKKELMAENRQVAQNQLEEWKALKKKVDGLIEELEELLKIH